MLLFKFSLNAIFSTSRRKLKGLMDYKKKSLNKLNQKESYEEIDTRLASGWYVDDINSPKKKIYKTKKTSFKLSRKLNS